MNPETQKCEQCQIDGSSHPLTNEKHSVPNSKVVLYSTHCPRCSVLEKKLAQLGIAYELNTNVEEMIALGMTSAPMLSVDGELLDFNSANEWFKKHQEEQE